MKINEVEPMKEKHNIPHPEHAALFADAQKPNAQGRHGGCGSSLAIIKISII